MADANRWQRRRLGMEKQWLTKVVRIIRTEKVEERSRTAAMEASICNADQLRSNTAPTAIDCYVTQYPFNPQSDIKTKFYYYINCLFRV